MKILVEGHSYPQSLVEKICGNFEQAKDGFIKVSKVGYYFNPAISDCVICLPKVVKDTKEDGSITYLGGLKAEDLIGAFSYECTTLNGTQKEFVQSFSLWSYRAISTFARLNPDSTIVTHTESTAYTSSEDANSGTLLDTIFAIIEFYNRNRDYFMYIIKNLHKGYNRINWQKTVTREMPLLQGGVPVYVDVVNKRKQINFDEELMVIFYSILNYISATLGLIVPIECSYDLITGDRFESYLDGLGEIRLKAIKYKYFSDKDIRLWTLCYDFFRKFSNIQSSDYISDYLLVSSFEIVFEAMIDALIGDQDLPDLLKNQEDGKIVDHIFKFKSPIDSKDIYYIGDSKYYAIGAEIGDKSIYKQFTYAKNIIQYHFAQSLKTKLTDIGYRDAQTEGYNFTPNFFISAYVPDEFSYEKTDLKLHPLDKDKHRISHFENRLFDRDTLWLTHFDINLLFVMALYSRDDSSEQTGFKSEFKNAVRKAFWQILTTQYDFYKVIPHSGNIKDFVKTNFMLLNGKIYTASSREGEILVLALEKDCKLDNARLNTEISSTADLIPITLSYINR